MPCHAPLRGHQREAGAPLSFSSAFQGRFVEVPCGRCAGCRLDHSVEWAVRCVHEAQMHERNCFVTLTYDDEHLPADLSLRRRDWQLFAKRLLYYRNGEPFRFFMCGEYGDLRGRPHFHACLFGVDFEDKVIWKETASGERLYRSAVLDSIWGTGWTTVGSVTFTSAAYVARYVMKKELGSDVPKRRLILDVTTGELVERTHEFCQASLRPGLGRSWLERFHSDVYPEGQVVVEGRKVPAPRYYDNWYKACDPDAFALLAARRQAMAESRFDDNSPRRNRAKEQVLRAKIAFLKRGLSE